MSEAIETAAAANPRHKWYIVHAYSNFEKKVAEAIRDQAKSQSLEDCFSDILVRRDSRRYDMYDLQIENPPALVPQETAASPSWHFRTAYRLNSAAAAYRACARRRWSRRDA